MSYNWSFHSFDYEKFEYVLTHSRRRIVDTAIEEMRRFHDDPKYIERHVRVGTRLVEQGFSYEGWPASDLKVIDAFVFELFYVCAEDINSTPESPEFLSPNVTCEFPSVLRRRFFWSRPKPIPVQDREYLYLPFFTHYGRRLGEKDPSYCEYVVLSLHEVRLLKVEIEKFLATVEGRDLDSSNDNTIRNDFLGPVVSAVGKRKALYAQLS